MSAVPVLAVPRESVELVALSVAVDGVPVTTYQVQAAAQGTRPTGVWAAPVAAGGDTGYLVSGLPVGLHGVWVRYVSAPETPVLLACFVRIT